ncbi:MAG TPA: ABC-type transport auxiliary lipoprotein family protein [Xanthobacteraceae bacterium]|nr:ABC-type transport auxiliary lipoprotein family protein [Xanthobacteraceae bacterium]
MGLFVLAVIVGGFAFVYWLHSTGGLTERAAYRIRFEDSVSGLRVGSAVLFNGMRVGEVTRLQLSPDNPRQVIATILVERSTPVRADTSVSVEVQGLMGSPSIFLKGGAPTAAALKAAADELPTLIADPTSTQDTMQLAREVLRRIDKVVAENSEPLRSTIANLNTFTQALARNSDRIDQIISGLVRLTGGGPEKAGPTIFDLPAPRDFPALDKLPAAQLAVPEPNAVLALDTQRILVRADGGESPAFADARWSDNLPKLIQAKIIQGFENAKFVRVRRSPEGPTSDPQLLIDIRHFRVVASATPFAEVEFAAKLLAADGQVLAARVFQATAPVAAMNAAAAASGLGQAFGKAATELVLWTLAALP